jgi:hypothetical protein
MFKEIRAKTAELNQQIQALQKEAASQIKQLLQEFITTHSQVKAIKWTQYTPHFNDGEPCVFGVSEFGFFFEGDDLDASHYDGELPYRYEDWEKRDVCSPETLAACDGLASELGRMEDALKTLFGDHVQVNVTADGVDVEEYDHD